MRFVKTLVALCLLPIAAYLGLVLVAAIGHFAWHKEEAVLYLARFSKPSTGVADYLYQFSIQLRLFSADSDIRFAFVALGGILQYLLFAFIAGRLLLVIANRVNRD